MNKLEKVEIMLLNKAALDSSVSNVIVVMFCKKYI